jgi:hypothetical protein
VFLLNHLYIHLPGDIHNPTAGLSPERAPPLSKLVGDPSALLGPLLTLMLAFNTNQFKKGINNVIPTLSSMPEQYPCTNRSLLVLYKLRICNYLTGTSRHEGVRQNKKPAAGHPSPRPPDPLMPYLSKMGYSLYSMSPSQPLSHGRTLEPIRNGPIPRHDHSPLLPISPRKLSWNNNRSGSKQASVS